MYTSLYFAHLYIISPLPNSYHNGSYIIQSLMINNYDNIHDNMPEEQLNIPN